MMKTSTRLFLYLAALCLIWFLQPTPAQAAPVSLDQATRLELYQDFATLENPAPAASTSAKLLQLAPQSAKQVVASDSEDFSAYLCAAVKKYPLILTYGCAISTQVHQLPLY
jgi:hypothetical protein